MHLRNVGAMRQIMSMLGCVCLLDNPSIAGVVRAGGFVLQVVEYA
jgi:hypothetical protein